MITAPGAAMLDEKVFVTRLADPWPDLFERWWDGEEWLWVNHGRPEGIPVKSSPGAAMMDEKLFVVSNDGRLWERHWRSDLNRWAWSDHGRPDNRPIVTAPGAAMMDEKLFVATDNGDLWERHWRTDLGRWAWEHHGRPGNQKVVRAAGAVMMDEKLFVVTAPGNLWERQWRNDLGRWAWQDHGRPDNESIIESPGAAMNDEKLFVVTDAGKLWELHWRSDLGRRVWSDHGRPSGTRLLTAPGAAIGNRRLFVGGRNGRLYERRWGDNVWVWVDHGRPPSGRVATAPDGAMLDSKLFVGTDNGRLFELFDTGGDHWVWVDHGKPMHDRSAHVIDNRTAGVKRNIAVLAEGFTEDNLHTFQAYVDEEIVQGVFSRDLFVEIRPAFNIVRIDLVSLESGVSQREYDEAGTPSEASDDSVLHETPYNTRLAYWYSGSWAHCWMELSNDSNARTARVLDRFLPDWDIVVVVLNESGGGGCRRGSALAVTRGVSWATVAHELGHALGDLADEYTRANRNYAETGHDKVNCAVEVARSLIKWDQHVAESTPLPTDANNLPSGWDNNQDVGAFEGCGTYETGVYRPVLRCRMNQNSPPFCPVCAEEMRRIHAPFL